MRFADRAQLAWPSSDSLGTRIASQLTKPNGDTVGQIRERLELQYFIEAKVDFRHPRSLSPDASMADECGAANRERVREGIDPNAASDAFYGLDVSPAAEVRSLFVQVHSGEQSVERPRA